MDAMKRMIYPILVLISSTFSAYSLTYTSIDDGDWNNTTSVWSLNGSTPCGCAPGLNLINDTVVIMNYINLTGHLGIDGAALLSINSGGSLANTAMRLTMRGGTIVSSGLLSVNELTLRTQAKGYFYSSVVNIQNRMEVAGIFEATFSNLYVQNGNIEVLAAGSFSLYGNTKIFFNAGNFNNYGKVFIDGESCIHLGAGNFRNFSSGQFNGTGTVISDNGNILNEGIWSPSLNWCVSGTATGLTTPENCSLANDICNFAPLAAELINFSVVAGENNNLISWYTYAEEPGDWYILERSADGRQWTQIGQQNSSGSGGEITHYLMIDEDPLKSVSYYKLIQYNANGSEGFTAILAVSPVFKQEIVVFPNPTSDRITIRFTQAMSNVSIKIVDGAGNVLERNVFENTAEESFILPYPCGLYFIYIDGENINETVKVIKR